VPAHYSPERRTALVLTGTGADGAYHAGVLRALDETGVKVDLVAARGMGALGAVLYAIDGAERLWEPRGVWRGTTPQTFYRWSWPFRGLGWLAVAVALVLVAPLAVALGVSVVYPVALALGMAGLQTGAKVAEAAMRGMGAAFAPGALPTWVPRIVAALVAAGFVAAVVGVAIRWWRAPRRRSARRPALWSLLGAPLDGSRAVTAAPAALWHILRGGAVLQRPDARDLSRRYADLLTENLGHPGFRELIIVAHDLDARRDVVFGLLKDPYRRAHFAATTTSALRRAEAHDLAGVARDHLVDALGAALSPAPFSEPWLVTFAADTYWRGESHRVADRPAALGRVVEEVAMAGVDQVILVSAAAEPLGPHELRPTRPDGLGRIGESLAAEEAAALRDALAHLRDRFRWTCTIRPAHNPVRPLDLGGAFDERSDRLQPLDELMERGYEDAYRQFIDPMVGASGEALKQEREQ
jgi:hypothetical protein